MTHLKKVRLEDQTIGTDALFELVLQFSNNRYESVIIQPGDSPELTVKLLYKLARNIEAHIIINKSPSDRMKECVRGLADSFNEMNQTVGFAIIKPGDFEEFEHISTKQNHMPRSFTNTGKGKRKNW